MKSLFTYVLILISLTCFGQTQKDVEVIDVINTVRTDPKSFILYLEKSMEGSFHIYPKEEVMGLIEELKNMKPLQPLVFDSVMYTPSYEWGLHLKGLKKLEHSNNFSENLCRVGNIGEFNPNSIIYHLLVDYMVKNKGHRKNLLNPDYKYISVSTNDFVCVQNFR